MLAGIFATFQFLLLIRLFWQCSRHKPLFQETAFPSSLWLVRALLLQLFPEIFKPFVFARTTFVIVVFVLHSLRTSYMANEILSTICKGLARYYSLSDMDYFCMVQKVEYVEVVYEDSRPSTGLRLVLL